MVRVNVIVEGDAELAFVKQVLSKPLAHREVFVTARKVYTSHDNRTNRYTRGGMDGYARPRNDIVQWLRQETQAYVTTMFDLFRLPGEFPGIATLPVGASGLAKAQHVETALEADIGNRRFVPYIQVHEFEALLFTDPRALDDALSLVRPSQLAALHAVRHQYANPEDINEGPETAPSKRLLSMGYDKTFHGPLVAEQIGLPALRATCPHFGDWVARLETLPPL